MQHYFHALGAAMITGAVALFIARLRFVRNASTRRGTVAAIRRMHVVREAEDGPSMHIEVEYLDERGERCRRVIDNSLLALIYRPGQKLELAVSGDRVLVKSGLNLVTAPLTLLVLGLATLCVPWLVQ